MTVDTGKGTTSPGAWRGNGASTSGPRFDRRANRPHALRRVSLGQNASGHSALPCPARSTRRTPRGCPRIRPAAAPCVIPSRPDGREGGLVVHPLQKRSGSRQERPEKLRLPFRIPPVHRLGPPTGSPSTRSEHGANEHCHHVVRRSTALPKTAGRRGSPAQRPGSSNRVGQPSRVGRRRRPMKGREPSSSWTDRPPPPAAKKGRPSSGGLPRQRSPLRPSPR